MKHRFSLATDQETRQSYFQLRAREYERTFGFDGSWLEQEDGYDHVGDILVAQDDGGKVIAGARMNISTPQRSMRLPMEHGSFSLPLLLPSMNLAERNYAEVSRLAVAEEYQDGSLAAELLEALREHARSVSTALVFSICPRLQARRYRAIGRMGLQRPLHVFSNIAVPAQFDIEMRLCLFAEEGAL